MRVNPSEKKKKMGRKYLSSDSDENHPIIFLSYNFASENNDGI